MEKPASRIAGQKPETVLARPVHDREEIPRRRGTNPIVLNRADILSALFKHKWKIVLGRCSSLPCCRGRDYLALFRLFTLTDAKLLVRTSLSEARSMRCDTTKERGG